MDFSKSLKSSFLLLMTGVLFITLTMTSCEKDDPDGGDEEEEVITNMTYTLTPSGGGTAVVLSFEDLDGDGGNEPVITDGALENNQTYVGVLELSNELADTEEEKDITAEVLEEADEHQFFFENTVSGLEVAYSDEDAASLPIGLSTSLTTTDAGEGTLRIILRHQPDKSAAGVSDGDISGAGGSTDIDVTFNVRVE